MTSWSDGYVTEIGYTHGYYRELAPSLQRFALLSAGFAPPRQQNYLELGFGQGLSACIHAAAAPCRVWATDFNPTQAFNAQDLMDEAGLDGTLLDDSFAELLARGDLPEFDHIGAHGIWTWVSDESRHQIVDIFDRHLSIGGIAYLSYNTLPGWGSSMPLRHLMCLHADLAGAPAQGIPRKVEEAIAYANRLSSLGAGYFTTHPEVRERLERMPALERNYVAHEYFNRNWEPMHFADFANWLATARLDYATSAHIFDHADEVNLSPDAQAMVRETGHEILRETLRDYFVNRYFRRDIFQRGRRRLSALEQNSLLQATRFGLQIPPADVSMTITCAVGEVGLQETIYRPLLQALAADGYKVKTLLELRGLLPQLQPVQVWQALRILVGLGHVFPGQDAAAAEQVRDRCKRLNRALCRRARFSPDFVFLASPELGAGIAVPRIEQLFLGARDDGHKTPDDWAQAAWSVMLGQAFRVRKDDRTLETPEENVAELKRLAGEFAEKRLPMLQGLGIA
ncbi:MAG: class I SAM-dependent methyltransferase [Alphaproteobacteria bacterium]|nr:class I SAM-dependent methyltransferase [Alphaproteobacteria bacterium]MBU0886493.1 class I SAM-dependent methyltransferase [Alphaproteobacteria bacterium]MBU1812284.1 class I SAM-dependent methyltransferase [Alphaproteobacteria bacterium]